ncbi:MAG: hypothetical protein M3P30_08355 [Chloroflexota bacterium]|nr:hypothetical protein [Chloroflexota bacterium]
MVSDDLFYDAEAKFARPIPVVSGIFVPDGGVSILTDVDGRQGLLFPAKEEWMRGDGLSPQDFPWPGWRRVELEGARTLRRFIELTTAADAKDFAEKHGPLWACLQHEFPCLWRGHHVPRDDGTSCIWVNTEPINWWLTIAQRMRAALESVAKIRDGQIFRDNDWRAMGWTPPEKPYGRAEPQGLLVSALVNGELERYGVIVGLNSRLEPEINAGLGFVPALWQQMVAVIGGGQAIAVCSSCGVPYLREGRAAKRGQRNYCLPCAERGAKQRLSRLKKTQEDRDGTQT